MKSDVSRWFLLLVSEIDGGEISCQFIGWTLGACNVAGEPRKLLIRSVDCLANWPHAPTQKRSWRRWMAPGSLDVCVGKRFGRAQVSTITVALTARSAGPDI